MIIREYGCEKMVCDLCDTAEHIIEGDFNSEVAIAKGDGWKITKPEGQWQHTCPSCAGSSTSRLAQAQKLLGLKSK